MQRRYTKTSVDECTGRVAGKLIEFEYRIWQTPKKRRTRVPEKLSLRRLFRVLAQNRLKNNNNKSDPLR